MSPITSYVMQTALTLVGIAVLAGVILYASRRLGPARQTGAMRLVDRLPLDSRRTVYLVNVGDSYLVLGGSEAGLTKLSELSELPPAMAAPTSKHGFRQLLSNLRDSTGKGNTPQAGNKDEPRDG